MNIEKFRSEIETLSKFISIYCSDKHQNLVTRDYKIPFKDIIIEKKILLCDECDDIFRYSVARLQECPHEEKPRCRKCPNPCYEKEYWKKVAKIMKYSGIKTGLSKIKNIFRL